MPFTLRLENYRRPFSSPVSALSEAERIQLQALIDREMDSEGMTVDQMCGDVDEDEFVVKGLEAIDVVDADGRVVANLLLYGYGDGAVVHSGTTQMIANICQHGISPHETTSPEWMAAFAEAFREGAPRLGVRDPRHIDFR
jgi:hypothetical protein